MSPLRCFPPQRFSLYFSWFPPVRRFTYGPAGYPQYVSSAECHDFIDPGYLFEKVRALIFLDSLGVSSRSIIPVSTSGASCHLLARKVRR